MLASDFDYELPQELIAQFPAPQRDASRLMVLHRDKQEIEHRHFPDLLEYLRPGDCLVVNDAKVIPARLLGRHADTGGKVELLLLRPLEEQKWEALGRPGRRLRRGACLEFGDGELRAEVVNVMEEGRRVVKFTSSKPFRDVVERLGRVPLPPYIRREPVPEDKERYQTVYARREGAVAAPTAGLHLTPEMLDQARRRGIHVRAITLHVGLGTFKPVTTRTVEEHKMHVEPFEVSPEAAEEINAVRSSGGRVFAVGTTTVRALESAADDSGRVMPLTADADLFIRPGYKFRVVDKLVTNFHLPRSTLLMLVSAFAGRAFIMHAYAEAIRLKYRFYSYGDAMLIL